MVPDAIKPGMTIYVNMYSLNVIRKMEYIGGDIFLTENGKEWITIDWSTFSYSFSEDQAQCKSYLYKLNQLQKQLDDTTKQTIKLKSSIDDLNESFGHLKEKFPEEFI